MTRGFRQARDLPDCANCWPPPRGREEARNNAQEVLRKARALEPPPRRPPPVVRDPNRPVAPAPPSAGRRSRDFDPDTDP